MYGYIYLTTNLINGRKYIGQKKSSYFKGTGYLGSGKILKQAVEKYGWDNFSVELIEECDSKETLDERERYWIKYYNAVDDPTYYNIAFGGQSQAHRLSLETRAKLSEAAKLRLGDKNPFYGKTHSQETREILRVKSREHWKDSLPSQKGKIWVTDGVRNHFCFEDEIPEGFRRGVTRSSHWLEMQHSRRVVKVPPTPEEIVDHQRVVHQNLSESASERNLGRVWINDGSRNKFIRQEDLDSMLSQGYKIGRLQSNEGHKGTFFITNGVESKLLKSDSKIPEGWWKGMTRHEDSSST